MKKIRTALFLLVLTLLLAVPALAADPVDSITLSSGRSYSFTNNASTNLTVKLRCPDDAASARFFFTHYNADGSIASDKIYDYRFDDQGNLCYRSKTSGGVIVNERYYEADENGRANMVREIAYREDGTKSDEYIFDAQGNQTQHIEYNPDGSIKE